MITDLKMPGQDGLSVIREARRTLPALPVIVITGYSSEATAIEAINLGWPATSPSRSGCRGFWRLPPERWVNRSRPPRHD